MKYEKLTLTNRNGIQLTARLDSPKIGHPVAYALFAHCFTCSKTLKAANHIAKALNELDIAVLRFDFTGLGQSEGDFSDTNFSTNVADIIDVAKFLEYNYGAPELLIGHSLGGSAILMAAFQIEDALAVATIASPSDVRHIAHLLKGSLNEIEKHGSAKIDIGGRPFYIKQQFINDLNSHQLLQTISDLKKPILILHSPLDQTVSISHAAELYKASKHPKSFISLDKADHLLTDSSDGDYVGAMIAVWAKKYLNIKFIKNPAFEEDKVYVRIGEEGYTSEILVNEHILLADEPLELGGKALGPNPYQYVLGGLGACTVMTLRMYANRKKWDLRRVLVTLSIQKEYYKDCEDCENSSRKLDVIKRDIQLLGMLNLEERQRLLEIADKCPVHKTLESQVLVETRLV